MTPIETSERKVIDAAKSWYAAVEGDHTKSSTARIFDLHEAVGLLITHEVAAKQVLGAVPQPSPRPGAESISRRPKKLSRKAQAIEARRLADISGQAAGRDDIDYASDDLPTAR